MLLEPAVHAAPHSVSQCCYQDIINILAITRCMLLHVSEQAELGTSRIPEGGICDSDSEAATSWSYVWSAFVAAAHVH